MTREQDYYNHASIWDCQRYEDPFEENRWKVCADLIPKESESLLDAGAGNGFFLRNLEEQRPELELIGIERSKAAILIKVCKSDVLEASIDAMPFSDGAFDLVSALDVIEHFPYGVYEVALQELQRVSRRFILINVPYRERRLRVVCPYCECEFNPHYHMRSFNEEKLLTLFPDFKLCSSTRLYRRESLLAAAARPFRRHVFSGFPETALCPQCGYRGDSEASLMPGLNGGVRHIIKNSVRWASGILPQIPITQEIAVLFERKGV